MSPGWGFSLPFLGTAGSELVPSLRLFVVAPGNPNSHHNGALKKSPFALAQAKVPELSLSGPDGLIQVPCLTLN